MSVNPLKGVKVPEGTILFADRLAADGLSLCSSFGELVPKTFAMVCDIECDNVMGLIEKFMSVFDFEHIAILISGPLSKYLKVIKSILEFGEFDIVLIMSTWPEDDVSVLPKQLHKVFQRVGPFVHAIRPKFLLVPTMPRLVPDLVFGDEVVNPKLMARVVEQVIKCQSEQIGKWYAFGDNSRAILDALDLKSAEGAAGVLLVDRVSCATPFFVHNASLLDSAASINVMSVLKDTAMIEAEIKGNTLKEMATTLKLPVPSTLEVMRKQWSDLTQEKKKNVLAKHPSLEFLLDRRYADLCQLETNILEGADLEEMLESFPLDLGKYLRLCAFAHMIEPIDAKKFVGSASEQCGGGMSEVRDEEQQMSIFDNCSSGVKLALGKSHRMRELFLLPKLIQSIVDKNVDMDGRIQGSTQGLLGTFGIFGKKGGLKDCKKIFVFVFGGISFFEMREITELLGKYPDVDLRIFSDTICSAIDLFSPRC